MMPKTQLLTKTLAITGFCVSALFFSDRASADQFSAEDQLRVRELQLQIEATSSNLNNYDVTRTPDGGPYLPLQIRLEPSGPVLERVRRIKIVYLPDHPDADLDGYVTYPDIDRNYELQLLMECVRSLDALNVQIH